MDGFWASGGAEDRQVEYAISVLELHLEPPVTAQEQIPGHEQSEFSTIFWF